MLGLRSRCARWTLPATPWWAAAPGISASTRYPRHPRLSERFGSHGGPKGSLDCGGVLDPAVADLRSGRLARTWPHLEPDRPELRRDWLPGGQLRLQEELVVVAHDELLVLRLPPTPWVPRLTLGIHERRPYIQSSSSDVSLTLACGRRFSGTPDRSISALIPLRTSTVFDPPMWPRATSM